MWVVLFVCLFTCLKIFSTSGSYHIIAYLGKDASKSPGGNLYHLHCFPHPIHAFDRISGMYSAILQRLFIPVIKTFPKLISENDAYLLIDE